MLTLPPEFTAAYISGVSTIILGNPLDILKTRLQAISYSPSPFTPSSSITATTTSSLKPPRLSASPKDFLLGTAAPICGYGALNGLLFTVYTEMAHTLSGLRSNADGSKNLWTTFVAGGAAGLATAPISSVTELVKSRVQVTGTTSSWQVIGGILRADGVAGLARGTNVTVTRDVIGYATYFPAYEGTKEFLALQSPLAETLVAGGVAGIVTWGSCFPLDVAKTRIQVAVGRRLTVSEVMREIWRESGFRGLWTGFGICCGRAVVVNALGFTIYESTLDVLGDKRF